MVVSKKTTTDPASVEKRRFRNKLGARRRFQNMSQEQKDQVNARQRELRANGAIEARRATNGELNPDVDRSPASREGPQPSKKVIELLMPDGPSDITKKTFTYLDDVDWTDTKSVSKLNEWRRDTFERYLPPLNPLATKPVPYHEEEDQWLMKLERPIGWDNTAITFNKNFQGRLLHNSPIARPPRNGTMLSYRRRLLDKKATLESALVVANATDPKKSTVTRWRHKKLIVHVATKSDSDQSELGRDKTEQDAPEQQQACSAKLSPV